MEAHSGRNKRTRHLLWFTLASLLIPFMVYSVFIEPNMIFVTTISIDSDNLSHVLGDKKVVHISDLHIASIGYRERKLIKMLNEIRPDILFITGDLLIEGKDYRACIEVLKRINRPRYGIWVTLGNTDRQEDDEQNKRIERFILEMGELGISVLENEGKLLELTASGDHLYILGVEGAHLSRSKLKWLFRDIPSGSPVMIISHYPDIFAEQSDALVVNLEETEDAGVSGWGWQDNSFTDHDSGIIRFEKDGIHTLRVQRREDGVSIEQICLVAEPNNDYNKIQSRTFNRNRADMYDAVNPFSHDMIIIKAKDILRSRMFGSWKKVQDPTADFNPVISDMPDSEVKYNTPSIEPKDYFETEFYAKGRVNYHVWVRMKAQEDLYSNDSIYVQFSDSIGELGNPVYRTGEFAMKNKFENVDLILAGHTHGGQMRIPFIGIPDIVPFHDVVYDKGLFEGQGTRMYVNRGIGTSIVPARFFCPPEITVLQFTKKYDNDTSERDEILPGSM